MFVCVHVHVCAYVCVHVCTCVCKCTCVPMYLRKLTYAYAYKTHACMHMLHIQVCAYNTYIAVCMYVCMYVCKYAGITMYDAKNIIILSLAIQLFPWPQNPMVIVMCM